MATEVKRSIIGDAVGSSWGALALAAEDNTQGGGKGTLLVEAGTGGGGRWEGGEWGGGDEGAG